MTRIAVCDDNPDVRYLLRLQLAGWPDIEIVHECETPEGCLLKVRAEGVDVAILDLSPDPKRTLALIPSFPVPVIVLSGHRPSYIADACRDAGAVSYLEKGCDPHVIADAIRDAASSST